MESTVTTVEHDGVKVHQSFLVFENKEEVINFEMMTMAITTIATGDKCMFVPYWFEKVDDLTYKMHPFSTLPEMIKEELKFDLIRLTDSLKKKTE